MSKIFDLGKSEPNIDCTCMACESYAMQEKFLSEMVWPGIMIFCIFLLCLIFSCQHATKESLSYRKEYTDEEIVQAIKSAQGGVSYGIKSVLCRTEVQCHDAAIKRIQDNRQRFALYGHRGYADFIGFLQSRYCPDQSVQCTSWSKNVRTYLKKENPHVQTK
jgi:hypothetical protein